MKRRTELSAPLTKEFDHMTSRYTSNDGPSPNSPKFSTNAFQYEIKDLTAERRSTEKLINQGMSKNLSLQDLLRHNHCQDQFDENLNKDIQIPFKRRK